MNIFDNKSISYNIKLVFQFFLILLVNFFIADSTVYILYFLLNENEKISHLYCVLKFISLPVLYWYLLTFSKVDEIKSFMRNLRYGDFKFKRDALIVALFIPFVVCLLSYTVLFSIKGLCITILYFTILYSMCFVVSLWSYLFLYLLWYVIDILRMRIKKIECKIEQQREHIHICVEDDLKNIRKISTFSFVLLSLLTNLIYMIVKMSILCKELNNLCVETKKINKKNIYIFIVLCIVLCIILIFSYFIDELTILTLIQAVLGLLLLSVGFLYTCEGLQRIETLALERHNIVIKYNRLYAFLLGVVYLNFAINNYSDRVNNAENPLFDNIRIIIVNCTRIFNIIKSFFKNKKFNYIVIIMVIFTLLMFIF